MLGGAWECVGNQAQVETTAAPNPAGCCPSINDGRFGATALLVGPLTGPRPPLAIAPALRLAPPALGAGAEWPLSL